MRCITLRSISDFFVKLSYFELYFVILTLGGNKLAVVVIV
jgi:hypothetical protein